MAVHRALLDLADAIVALGAAVPPFIMFTNGPTSTVPASFLALPMNADFTTFAFSAAGHSCVVCAQFIWSRSC